MLLISYAMNVFVQMLYFKCYLYKMWGNAMIAYSRYTDHEALWLKT